jgi:3-oxoacyl-[acyl-carrier protein] reductase
MALLHGKTALITGASKGIGKAIAMLFAAEGAQLVLTGRNTTALDTVKAEVTAHPSGHLVYEMDVRNPAAVKQVFDDLQLKQKIGLDILVNNAGIMKDATLQMAKPELMHEIYETNVFGTMYPAQQAVKAMLRKRSGSIINLTSIIGTKGNPGQTVYGSSKSAIIGFTTSLSKELAGLNIRVNAIAPGFIDTDMTRGMDPKFYEKNLASIGMKRIGTPEDVAKVALFLASDLSGYVTGQVIGVDGGMVL